ncbi:MAG: ATP-binding cassette domain-containing protein [Sphingobacteriales bacterium]|nr:MAG: ATP-binding cassette domain-containing protein [Sphingobacteriales bacterium]
MNVAPAIQVQHLQIKQYGKTILQDVFFTLNSGEHLLITGAAGAGKTTLGKAIAGKIFYKGSIDINNSNHTPEQAQIVMIEDTHRWKNLTNQSQFYYQQRFNSCDATDSITVEADLLQHLQQFGISDTEALYLNYCQQFNLLHRLQTPLIQLSNGEQKKLQIIKALLLQPQLLIADNIMTGLDVAAKETLLQILQHLSRNGTTLIFITSGTLWPDVITHVLTLELNGIYAFLKKSEYQIKNTYTTPLPRFMNATKPIEKQTALAHSMIEIKNTTIQYGSKKILDNINWQVHSGEKWLIQGHNGAGKSTLLSLITGDNPQAYANQIKIFGKQRGKGESIWDIKKRIGYISPELHKYFDTDISVEKTIASGFFDTMGVYKKLTDDQQIAISAIMQQFHLNEYSQQKLGALSLGLQRWVLLARALVKNPPLLILDEPCQGLDEAHIQHFLSTIQQIVATNHTTLIYVTHVENEIPEGIDFVLQLQQDKQFIHQHIAGKVSTSTKQPETLESIIGENN